MENIKRARGSSLMSQEELAELTGLSSVQIGRYERGEQKPSIEALTKIADVLGTTTDYLIGRG